MDELPANHHALAVARHHCRRYARLRHLDRRRGDHRAREIGRPGDAPDLYAGAAPADCDPRGQRDFHGVFAFVDRHRDAILFSEPQAMMLRKFQHGGTKMKWTLSGCVMGLALFAGAGVAFADGELNIYNWGNYTSPELIKKFEDTYKVKVTVTDYDSNDTALAKIKAGGHGFDIVVPSASYVPIWIQEGLLLESRP